MDAIGATWSETAEERAANEDRLDWAESYYFKHPKQTNKHASLMGLCKIYDIAKDKALFECHHSAWVEHWQREGAKFTPALVKTDGSGFLPDGAWRKPPPGFNGMAERSYTETHPQKSVIE